MGEEKRKIRVAGMVITIEFQKSKTLAERLHSSFPNDYEKPEIFPMLNVEWSKYLMKVSKVVCVRERFWVQLLFFMVLL